MAVEALALNKGDTVVDIGCGTGLNFPLLQEKIGLAGKIVGVDMTAEMLDQARIRAARKGWSNVELVQADAAHYAFPNPTHGVISTLAITLVPEYDTVIRNGAAALRQGGRFVILDLKKPANWPPWLVRLGVWLAQPFGVSLDLAERHPWQSMDKYLSDISITELYWGIAYVAVGHARR
jgi:demethylmenaquinone methyltransferase/2-methoxy-6-polyprenyl-1,4-benzoquinol methylase